MHIIYVNKKIKNKNGSPKGHLFNKKKKNNNILYGVLNYVNRRNLESSQNREYTPPYSGHGFKY